MNVPSGRSTCAPGAIFRKLDLHVHTPGSADLHESWRGGSPKDVVRLALDQGLDGIAITDHNSVEWYEPVREAAQGTRLTVLPGVEISTRDGHLLSIFDSAKPVNSIRELLIRIGFGSAQFGDLAVIADRGMDDVARQVEAEGGLAIAAHIDKPRGFWTVASVGARRQELHACKSISAFEVEPGDLAASMQEGSLSGYGRQVACVQGSDSWTDQGEAHRLDGIGRRYCFIKLDAFALEGLRQAFLDPEVRIRSHVSPPIVPDCFIEGFFVSDGFLKGQNLRFNPGISCLIGGTGAGKSLSLELVRFALDQQVVGSILPGIAREVDGLLDFGLPPSATVSVVVSKSGDRFLVERTRFGSDSPPPVVSRIHQGGEVEPLADPVHLPTFFPIKGYSQSEIIEYSREPLARLSLVDNLIDTTTEAGVIAESKRGLRENAAQTIEAWNRVDQAQVELRDLPGIQEQLRSLERFFEDDRVKSHQVWERERAFLDFVQDALDEVSNALLNSFEDAKQEILPPEEELNGQTPNSDVITSVKEIAQELAMEWPELTQMTTNRLRDYLGRLATARQLWDERFAKADRDYRALLAKLDEDGVGRVSLDERMRRLREEETRLRRIETALDIRFRPALKQLNERREALLTTLQQNRRRITARRQEKARELTSRLHDQVRVRIISDADSRKFIEALRVIRTGTHISDSDLRIMAEKLHPVRFVKSLLASDLTPLAAITGLPQRSFERLREVILERERRAELFDLQIVDLDDGVEIRFSVEGQYRHLQALAHGQKCTVVLMISLAEGEAPLLVDQPEDALHAPWIEQYIVRQLRNERGTRQCLFATRSANVVVSADAEQIVAMDSNADAGWVKKAGGIDSFDTRELVLYHVEGGKEPFSRRRSKYGL